MLMHDPPHAGAFIRRQCLEPLGLTVTEAAKGLCVSRNTLSLLLNGRLGISPEMAIRLSEAFGGSPESWLQQQCSTTSGAHNTTASRSRSAGSPPPELRPQCRTVSRLYPLLDAAQRDTYRFSNSPTRLQGSTPPGAWTRTSGHAWPYGRRRPADELQQTVANASGVQGTVRQHNRGPAGRV